MRSVTIILSQSATVNCFNNITKKSNQLVSLVDAYSEDYWQFCKSNNKDRLELAGSALSNAKGSPLVKALVKALGSGFIAGAIDQGFISRGTGGIDKQNADIQGPFTDALGRAVTAFENVLIESGLFAEKTPKSEAEKIQAKEAKEAKAKEAKEAMITAMIQSGELVRASEVHSVDALSLFAENEALRAENETLRAELAKWTQYRANYDKALALSVVTV